MYLDKVITNVGLVISLYDIIKIDGGLIHPGEGAPLFQCEFRLVVFKPVIGEVILGTISRCTAKGIQVSIGFFHDIFIPEHSLQVPSTYNESESAWYWTFNDQDHWMEAGDTIRFKVQEVTFPAPPTPQELHDAVTQGLPNPGTLENPFAPMLIQGNVFGDGLGMVSWWTQD